MSLLSPDVYRDVDPEASLGLGPRPEQPTLPDVDWTGLDDKYSKNFAFAQAAQRAKWNTAQAQSSSGGGGSAEGMSPAEVKLLRDNPGAWAASSLAEKEKAYPGIDPDLALHAMVEGIEDPKVWEEMWESSKEATRAEVVLKREEEEVPRDWGDAVAVTKGVSRSLFTAMMAPLEMVNALGRTNLPEFLSVEGIVEAGAEHWGVDVDVPSIPGLTSSAPAMKVKDQNVQGDFRTVPLLDQVWTALGSNMAAQAIGAALAGEEVNHGDGWLPGVDYDDPTSIAGITAARNNRMAYYVPEAADYLAKKREDGTWAVYGPGKDEHNFTPGTSVPGDNIASGLLNMLPSAGASIGPGTGDRNVVRVFQTQAEADAYVAAPKPYTPFGDALTVTLAGMKYGSEQQRVASGVADGFTAIVLDPINFIPIGGMGGKAAKATQKAGEGVQAASVAKSAEDSSSMITGLLTDVAEQQRRSEALKNTPTPTPPPATAGQAAATPPPPPGSTLPQPPAPPAPGAGEKRVWDAFKTPHAEDAAVEAGAATPLSPRRAWEQEAAETMVHLGLRSDEVVSARAMTYELEKVYRVLGDAETRAHAAIAREKAELEGRIAGLSDAWASDSLGIARRDADWTDAEAARIGATADSTGQGNAAWRAGKVGEEADQIRDRGLAEEAVAAAKQDELDALKAMPMPVDEAEQAAHAARIAALEQEVAGAISLRMPIPDSVNPAGLFDEQLQALTAKLARLNSADEVTRRVLDIWDLEGPQRTWLYSILTDPAAPMSATKAAAKPAFELTQMGKGKWVTTDGWEINQVAKGKWTAKNLDTGEVQTFKTKKAAAKYAEDSYDSKWAPVAKPDDPMPRAATPEEIAATPPRPATPGAAGTPPPPPVAQGAAKVADDAAEVAGEAAADTAQARREAIARRVQQVDAAAQEGITKAKKTLDDFIAANPTIMREVISGKRASGKYANMTDQELIEAVSKSPAEIRNLMDDILGVVRNPDGSVQLDIDSFLQAILGKKMDRVFEVLGQDLSASKLSRLFRNALPQSMIGEIAAAKNVDEVRSVFVHWLADGRLLSHTDGMRELRRWSRIVARGKNKGEPVQVVDGAFLDLIDRRRLIPRAIRWGAENTKKGVPWSYRVKADDVDAVVAMFQDSFDWIFRNPKSIKKSGFTRKELDEIEDRYFNRILNAPGGPERKDAWLDFWDEMLERTLKNAKDKNNKLLLDEKELGRVKEVFKQHQKTVQGSSEWNVAERALLAQTGDSASPYAKAAREHAERNGIVDDLPVGDGNASMYASTWNEWMWAPNPKALRRIVRDIERVKKGDVAENGWVRAYDTIFDKHWRTLVLIMRPAFTMRNMLDAQVRLFLGGYPNVFSNPLQTIAAFHAAVSEPKSRLFKAMYKLTNPIEHFDKMRYRPDGNGWLDPARVANEVDVEDFEQGLFEIMDWKQSVADIQSSDAQMMKSYGWRTVSPTEDANMYWRGVSNQLGQMWADPLFRTATNITLTAAGRKTGRIPPSLASYAKTIGIDDLSKSPLRTQQDVLIHATLHGDGEYALAWRKIRAQVLKRDKLNAENFADPEYLRRYFFGDDSVYSYKSRLARYTEYDDEIIEALWAGRYDKLSTQMSGTPTSWAINNNARVLSRNEELQDLLRAKFKDTNYTKDNVPQSVAPMWDKAPDAGTFAGVHRKFIEGFFNTDLWYQRGYQIPFYKERFWEITADLLPTLSKPEADKVMAIARKNFRGPSMPNSYKTGIKKKLDEGYRKVGEGLGGMTVEDIMKHADRIAGDEAFSMFYTARQRNQFAHKVRAYIPFAQAWANTLKVWGTLAAEMPLRLHKPVRAYQAAKSPGASALPALFNDDPEYNPDRPLIWQDKGTGQMVYEIPLMGAAISSIANVGAKLPIVGGNPAGHLPGTETTSTLDSLNLLFQGGFFPGVSPPMQLLAQSLSGTKAWANTPNVLGMKDQVLPYRDPDAAQASVGDQVADAFLPSVVKSIAALGGGDSWSTDTARYASQAMSAAYSTNPEGYHNPDGALNREKLEADARLYAKWMVFSQGAATISYPGTVKTKPLTSVEDGTLLTQEVISRDFYTEAQALGGDRGLALAQMMKKYGPQALLALVSARDGAIRPTTEGWTWFQNHRDEVTASNAQDILPYFFVKDGVFSKEYNLYLRNYGKNQRQTPQEMITQSEMLLKAMEVDQLNVQYARGEISEDIWERTKTQIAVKFSARGVTDMAPAARTEKINSMKLALEQSPSLRETPGGQQVEFWLELRDEALLVVQSRDLESHTASADPFKAKAAADIRLWLYNTGEQMATEDENFKHAWNSVFKYEVSP